MPVTKEEILAAEPHKSDYPAILIVLQKLFDDGDLANKILKDHSLNTMLGSIADGLYKGDISYLLRRFPDEAQKQKVRAFFNATGDKIGETPNDYVIAAIGEAYVGLSDKNIHFDTRVLGNIYQKLLEVFGFKREKEEKINAGVDPFYKIGEALLQKKRPLTNREFADVVTDGHAKIFFAESCQEDGLTASDRTFEQWKGFNGDRDAFARQQAIAPAAHLDVKEHKSIRHDPREALGPAAAAAAPAPTSFSEEKYHASYKEYQKKEEYISIDKLKWKDLFDKAEEKELKSGGVAYDFESLERLLPDLKIPESLKGRPIQLPNDLAKAIDDKLAIELQKNEYNPPRPRG